jgi:hypothetical protein
MTRLLLGLLVATGLLAFLATESRAHGGAFRGPGGAVPPDLRRPSDPTPPPPPPPSGGGTGGETPPGTPPGVPPTTPEPPVVTPPPTGDATTTGGGRKTPPSFVDWTFWYHHNKDEIENLKRRLYTRVGSGGTLAIIGGGAVTNRGDETRLTQRKVEDAIVPSLLWAMDSKNARHSDTESAAYIALAKVARSPDHVARIARALDPAARRSRVVREAAALALGLLRRAAPEDQLSARELDDVRTRLFGVFEDRAYDARTRGFAALAIGLLGDQPTGSQDYLQAAGKAVPTASDGPGDAPDARALGEAVTTERLWRLLDAEYAHPDLPIALVLALGLQPSTSVTAEMREELGRQGVLKGRLFGREVSDHVRGHAAVTLARVGGASEAGVLELALRARDRDPETRWSAALGLGILARSVPRETRATIAAALTRHGLGSRDDTLRNFSIIGLAHALAAEVHEESTALLESVGPALLHEATEGRYHQRPFGALALGLVAERITDENEVEAWHRFEERALGALRAGLDDPKMDGRSRAAFATGLGIARDARSRTRLVEIVGDRRQDKELRAYAALALGLVGDAVPNVTRAIADALQERSSEELRRQAAVALGLLGNPKVGDGRDAIQILVQEVREADTMSHRGQAVVALARIGNDRAVDTLVSLLRDVSEQDLTRALACAGLGIVGDLEWIPSLSRLGRDVNYRLSGDLLNEVLSIL